MTERDDKLARRYRELAREEPPAALDASILAASRRAVAAKLSGVRRWAVPTSIAAVLVLAFGVTLQMQREDPGVAYSPPAPAALPAPEPARAPAFAPEPGPASIPAPAPSPAPAPATAHDLKREARPAPKAKAEKKAAALSDAQSPASAPPAEETFRAKDATANVAPAAPAPPPAVTTTPASAAAPPVAARAAPAPAAQGAMRLQAAPVEPGAELERIAKLREDGKHEEADKALEEFRRKFPAYRIPGAMWERVRAR